MMKVIAVASILLIGSALSASAEQTYILKDVRSPAGHARSQATKFADGRVCGASASNEIPTAKGPAFLDCMRSHGWALSRIIPDRSAQVRQASNRPRYTESDGDSAADDESSSTSDWWAAQNANAVSDDQNAEAAEIGAETQAAGEAQMEADQQAASQAEMLQADQQP
jgi:hypothetical protein